MRMSITAANFASRILNIKKFFFQISDQRRKSLSTMADVLIRSFSKILSLLVGPTNVAIDNWTFQMFYKVQQTRENIVVDGNFICFLLGYPHASRSVYHLRLYQVCLLNLKLKARFKISLLWQQF